MKKIIITLVCAAIGGGAIYGIIKIIKTCRELPKIDLNKPDSWEDYKG